MLATSTPWFAMALLTASRASLLSCATTSSDGGSSFETTFGLFPSWPLFPYRTLVVAPLTTLSRMAPPDFRFVVCLSESWLFVYELSLVQLSVLSVWSVEQLESRCFQLECQMQTDL